MVAEGRQTTELIDPIRIFTLGNVPIRDRDRDVRTLQLILCFIFQSYMNRSKHIVQVSLQNYKYGCVPSLHYCS